MGEAEGLAGMLAGTSVIVFAGTLVVVLAGTLAVTAVSAGIRVEGGVAEAVV